ncbi:MAG: hypothetical protein ABSB63_09210 [Spirochaetia bacterium]
MNAGGRALLMLLSAASVLASCATAPQKEPQPAPQAIEPPPNAVTEPTPAEQFVATEELYKKTFNEVQAVIAELTRIIAEGDYSQWLTYLTTDYVRTTGSAAFLDEASQAGVLKKNGIALTSLQDYFENVVVRSRLQARLEDINFVDETHVKAITRIQGAPVILYYLVQEEGRWKVGILPSGAK